MKHSAEQYEQWAHQALARGLEDGDSLRMGEAQVFATLAQAAAIDSLPLIESATGSLAVERVGS